MDRVTGRSLFVPVEREALLRVAASAPDEVPEHLMEVRRRVVSELAAAGIGTLPEPRFDTLNTLILKLTKACNYGCTYCYDYEPSDSGSHLEVELALKTVGEALQLAGDWLQLIFHGGEPFLMFDRIERIVLFAEAEAARLGKRIVFNGQTNLSRLTDESVRFSLQHDIHWGFSLDGPPRRNDAFRVLRNGDGTHHHFADALGRYPEFVRNCGVSATITSANHDDLLGVSRYFHGHGLSGWDWTLFQPIGRARDGAAMDFDVGCLIASWNELFDAVVDGEFDGFAIRPILKYVDNLLLGPGQNMCMRKDCGAARDLMSVSCDGQLEACDCIDRTGPLSNLGHAADTSLAAALGSETAERIRSRDTTRSKCDDCIWLAVCGGSCLAYAPGLHEVYEKECQVALNAFDRVTAHLAVSDRLVRYRESCYERAPVRAAAG
jgi:uncharacterized protein